MTPFFYPLSFFSLDKLEQMKSFLFPLILFISFTLTFATECPLEGEERTDAHCLEIVDRLVGMTQRLKQPLSEMELNQIAIDILEQKDILKRSTCKSNQEIYDNIVKRIEESIKVVDPMLKVVEEYKQKFHL